MLEGLSPSSTALTDVQGSKEDQPLFTVAGGAGGDTVYASTRAANTANGGTAAGGLASESADEALLARFFDPAISLLPATTLARISYTTSTTSSPLRFSAAQLAALRRSLSSTSSPSSSTPRIPLVILVGRGRRDAPSHSLEATQLLKENVDAVRTSVLVSSEVRRAIGDAGVGVLLTQSVEEGEGGACEMVVVVQRRGKGGRVGGGA